MAFSLIAFGGPEASVELHQARAAGDEALTAVLEGDLGHQQTMRITTIVLLFAGSVAMTVVAFVTMRRRA